ncbi:MAG: polyphosphate kinase 1 [Pseudanabaenaceae cyanobacterium SKYGB_i_bin29]|nr:polyphosphate kinase 1 [Pseudanabaenaceae cyanobacterium SKYG29]MDW8420602.1 polyphosphate kinase 1 [Pseudanabaenaceae cyanobacterium SKYGB_i_bin29]
MEQRYFNRELSWLAFNDRVLCEGIDPRTPLLERVKFVAIFSSNLDEFFMVRVANVKRAIAQCLDTRTDDGLTPRQQLQAIRAALVPLVQKQQDFFEHTLRPALEAEGIFIFDYKGLDKENQIALTEYYEKQVFPVLTPLAIDPSDPGHPFPYISNLSLNLAVEIADDTGNRYAARVKVPTVLPRFVPLPHPKPDTYAFIPLEEVIGAHLHTLFPGMTVLEYHPFRITRDAELDIQEDEADDLISALKEELRKQKFGPVTRLEISDRAPLATRKRLQEQLSLGEEDIYDINGLVGLGSLMDLTHLPLPHLKDKPWRTSSHPRLKQKDISIFDVIKGGDLLVHHPYQSFTTTVQRLIEEAADDPQVLAIKQTLYRTSGDSPIVHALIRAAENGKQVAVLVELKARFDEANNIAWAKKLEDTGVHVVYGIKYLKTHTKTAMVVRKEGNEIVRYCHIGTGNYNPRTARFYSDLGILTCNEELAADLTDLFNYLTGYSRQREYRRILVAPVTMRQRFLQLIDREKQFGKGGRIIAKMNALVDPQVIDHLYDAAQAGVEIDLVVRGICCLRPGVPGLSETIRVVSIIGRFLEHSRIFYFGNGGNPELYIGSADWMPRNLDARVEVVTPVLDPQIQAELKQIIDTTLADNRQAWDLQPDGKYIQRHPAAGEPERASQVQFMLMARPNFFDE